MAEILLFHHAYGLTESLRAYADRLRAEGHVVHAPDAYAGRRFARLDDGVQHAQDIGHDALADVAHRAARQHRSATVAMGFGLGTMQAQLLAQDLPRIRGCVLMGGALAPRALGSDWRPSVQLDVHLAEPDEWVEEESLQALRYHAPHARVFRYPDRGHLFPERDCRDWDGDAADLFEERVDEFLSGIASADHTVTARGL